MKVNKVFSILLSVTIATTSLIGCVADKKDAKVDESKELKLSVWYTQGTDYVNTSSGKNIVEEWVYNKTRVKVDSVYGNDGGQWDPKLSKLVVGDNLPSLVVCGAGQGPSHFAKLDQLGKVWALTPELIQKYAPNMWAKTRKKDWDKFTVGGKILGFPYAVTAIDKTTNPDLTEDQQIFGRNLMLAPKNDVFPDGNQFMWIRDDILRMIYPEAKTSDELVKILDEKKHPIGDELLDIPIYTTDDYIKFLYKIKDLNLEENGKTVFPFGYNGSDNWTALSWFGADMLGYKTRNYCSTWNTEKEQIEIPLVGDMIKEAAKIQNKMIRDKVIDPESLVHPMAMYNEKILNGLYAIAPVITTMTSAKAFNDQLKKEGKTFQYRPFVTQVAQRKGYEPLQAQDTWYYSVCFLKTLSENDFYRTLKWFDLQFSDEFNEVLYWGPKEMGLYTETSDGKRKYKDERFNKYFIENDVSALPKNEGLGLGGLGSSSFFPAEMTIVSKFKPQVLLNVIKYTPDSYSGFKFNADSKHIKNLKQGPPNDIWAAEFAAIPEVIKFWAEREQWESAFKISFASGTDIEFEKTWTEAIKTLDEIVDVNEMAKKMTDIAKPIYDSMKGQ